jgi:hypothetical protein
MVEGSERARIDQLGSTVLAHLRLRALALWSDVALGSVDIGRLSLVAFAVLLQSAVLLSPGHFRPAPDLFFAVFVTGGTLLSLVLCGLAVTDIRRWTNAPMRRGMALCALVGLAGFSVLGVQHAASGVSAYLSGQPYNNDGAVMDHYAAMQALHGRDPYLRTNLPQALAALDVPATTTTPLMRGQFRGLQTYPSPQAVQQVFMNVLRHRWQNGVPIPPEFESKYNYPAGSFLLIMPFVAFGVHDLRFLYAFFLLLMGAYLWARLPRSLRILAPLLILADLPLIMLTAGGQPDTMYGFFLLIGLAEWRSTRTSSLAMGLAVATKQIAWFFLPFYLILIVRQFGVREALRRSGVIVGLYVLMNAYFIAESPGSYLAGISGPMSDPMFPLGTGIIALFVAGFLPMVPKAAFALMEMGAWIGGVAYTARTRVLFPATVAALGALPLFFAWRSLANYFYLVPVLALAVYYASSQRDRVLDANTTALPTESTRT